MNIYEWNSKAWNLLIIRQTDIPFEMARHCNKNVNESWKELIEKYEVTDKKQEGINEVKNRWTTCSIKDTIQHTYIWSNGLYNLNLNTKKTKEKYEKYEYEMEEHVFDILPEEYKPVRVSWNVKILNMEYKDLKK